MNHAVGKEIVRLRQNTRFKDSRELALATGIAPITLHRIEKGEQQPTPETLAKISACLNVTPTHILQCAGYLCGPRSLGVTLKGLRQSLCLTQQELADRLNLSRVTYVHYELDRRQPDCSTLQLFADFFEVNIDFLLGRTDEPRPINQLIEPLSSRGARRAGNGN